MVEGKNWQENRWYWQKVLLELELRGFGTDYLFSMTMEVDMKNSSKRIIYVNLLSEFFFLKIEVG